MMDASKVYAPVDETAYMKADQRVDQWEIHAVGH